MFDYHSIECCEYIVFFVSCAKADCPPSIDERENVLIAVLADDLTSALDGAAPFADRGLKVKVVFDSQALSAAADGADVLSVDLDSRFADPDVAEERFRTGGAALAHARLLYKTMDSTLRGNLCPEARGAMAGSGRSQAVVAPAFPAAGRTTSGGRQFVHGVAVELTEYARDTQNPVSNSLIADHFADLGVSAFRVEDAANDSDLDALVSQIGLSAHQIWVGSPGLAAALARAVPAGVQVGPDSSPAVRRVLVVVGSQHPANAAQVDQLKAAGAALVRAPSPLPQPQVVAEAITAAFESTDLVCVLSPEIDVADHGWTPTDLARWLGAVAERSTGAFEGLVVTGGDTARRIVDALGAGSMDLVGEVEPGVCLGLLHSRQGRFPFAAKAGGFGAPDTLARCVTALRSKGASAQ